MLYGTRHLQTENGYHVDFVTPLQLSNRVRRQIYNVYAVHYTQLGHDVPE
jgi:hypothetical protein